MSTTLPFPVAALLRRHRNAKSGKERHDSAYWAWEASVRLAVAAHPPPSAELRGRLARASAGDWFAALDGQERVLVDPALLELYAHCTEAILGAASRPKGVKAGELLSKLAGYRNATIGHGGMREPSYYEQGGRALAAGLQAAWDQGLFLPTQSQLLHCDEVQRTSDGGWRARLYDLAGESPVVLDPSGTALQQELLPQRIYMRHQGRFIDLHPWTLFLLEEESFLLFHALARTSPKYIDLVSGEHRGAQELELLHPQLVADARALFSTSAQGAAAQAEATAARPGDGEAFGDYTLLGKLGEGGMGVVYLARQESLGRLVALKQLRVAAGTDPVAEARFRREVKALSRCDHPNVVKIHAYGRVGDTLYFAMEYIEGADLGAVAGLIKESDDVDTAVKSASEGRAKSRPLAEKDLPQVAARMPKPRAGRSRARALAELFAGAADGLAHLHERGILHRDIKPSNIMVTWPEPRAVVMDLGLAKLSDASMQLSSDHTRILGTLRYMAPEQLQRGLIEVDTRADVYGLGATMYELLADRAFRDAQTEQLLIRQALEETAPALHKVSRSVPRTLSKIVAGATERDARRRYGSAAALAEDLRAFLSDQPIRYEPPGPAELLRLWVARHKALSATAAASVVTLIGLSAAFVVRLDRERQRAEDGERQAKEANSRLSETVGQLEASRLEFQQANESLRERNDALAKRDREAKLRDMPDRLEAFRAQCQTLDGLEAIGRPIYQWWLEEAGRLVNGQVEMAEAGLEWLPGIHDVRAKLRELRARSLPQSDEDRERDFGAHWGMPVILRHEGRRDYFAGVTPDLEDEILQHALRKIHERDYYRRILGMLAWPSESAVESLHFGKIHAPTLAKVEDEKKMLFVPAPPSLFDAESTILELLLERRLAKESGDEDLIEAYRSTLAYIGRFDEAVAPIVCYRPSSHAQRASAKLQLSIDEYRDYWHSDLERPLRMQELSALDAELRSISEQYGRDVERELNERRLRSTVLRSLAEWPHEVLRRAVVSPRSRQTWRFNSLADVREHDSTVKLLASLEALQVDLASAQEACCSDRARKLWLDVRMDLQANENYSYDLHGYSSLLNISPQVGLLPIGKDPGSGLWEFAYVPTSDPKWMMQFLGQAPKLDEVSDRQPEAGIVLVLVPGGTYVNRDHMIEGEQLEQEVRIDPFFIAKHTISEIQWEKLNNRDKRGQVCITFTAALPKSGHDILSALNRGFAWLDLPTEAQWEFALRSDATEPASGIQASFYTWLCRIAIKMGDGRTRQEFNSLGLHGMNSCSKEAVRFLGWMGSDSLRQGDGRSLADPGNEIHFRNDSRTWPMRDIRKPDEDYRVRPIRPLVP